MKNSSYIGTILILVMMIGCGSYQKSDGQEDLNVDNLFIKAEKQLALMLDTAMSEGKIPRTISKEGRIHWVKDSFDWTEGFFPGSLWYLYKNSGNEKWKMGAEYFQSLFETHKYKTDNHDLGFIFNTSFANGYELTGNEDFAEVLVTAADSLITRFNSKVGCIKSWDTNDGWQAKRDWKYPVIIDNMMNLELLFKATKMTNDPKYSDIAIAHAETTLKNHFRLNNSSYHVVDYDPIDGTVRKKETAQGFSNESSWARGQAWGLYGYTVCYRYTKNRKYLVQAEKIANFIISKQKEMDDCIPFWDYDAPDIPNEPKDASAAAITLSALLELDVYSKNSYGLCIDMMLQELSSDKYSASVGENHNFLLKHSVGSIPHDNEIDVPLSYADYYYLEALTRYAKRKTNNL